MFDLHLLNAETLIMLLLPGCLCQFCFANGNRVALQEAAGRLISFKQDLISLKASENTELNNEILRMVKLNGEIITDVVLEVDPRQVPRAISALCLGSCAHYKTVHSRSLML